MCEKALWLKPTSIILLFSLFVQTQTVSLKSCTGITQQPVSQGRFISTGRTLLTWFNKLLETVLGDFGPYSHDHIVQLQLQVYQLCIYHTKLPFQQRFATRLTPGDCEGHLSPFYSVHTCQCINCAGITDWSMFSNLNLFFLEVLLTLCMNKHCLRKFKLTVF